MKVLLTNICIQFGLKGGHFFPVIFAGVCMGYGVGMLICGNAESHLVFASAIVTAALLGGTMKKPLAVTMLLFLCYPVKLFVWILWLRQQAANAYPYLIREKWKTKIPLSENSAEFFTFLRCLPVLLWKVPGDVLIYPGTSLPFHDAASLQSVRNN